jgi:hypothetical protein
VSDASDKCDHSIIVPTTTQKGLSRCIECGVYIAMPESLRAAMEDLRVVQEMDAEKRRLDFEMTLDPALRRVCLHRMESLRLCARSDGMLLLECSCGATREINRLSHGFCRVCGAGLVLEMLPNTTVPPDVAYLCKSCWTNMWDMQQQRDTALRDLKSTQTALLQEGRRADQARAALVKLQRTLSVPEVPDDGKRKIEL